MIKNYFKTAWRSLAKNKTFTLINILGLTVGLTCCMLIILFTLYEGSYDKHQEHADRIYQMAAITTAADKEMKMPYTPAPMAETVRQNFPEVEDAARLASLYADDKTLIQYATGHEKEVKSFYEAKGYLTDPSFFGIFSYHFTEGSPQTALNGPNTIVLSEDIARKIFGKEPALNKLLQVNSSSNGNHTFTVTGVFKPDRRPSHIDSRFFMSLKGGDTDDYLKERGNNLITDNMFYTYLLLKPGSDYRRLESKFPAFMEKYAGKDLKAAGFKRSLFLIPLTDIHLRPGVSENVTPNGNSTYLYILGSIAVFILLIACINFMNLSTAHSSKRATEIGIRKVLGAQRGILIRQFLAEAIILSGMALLVSLVLTKTLLPLFSYVSGKDLTLDLNAENIPLLTGFILLSILTGLLAGSYPAFYLSSFTPVKVLKGKLADTFGTISLRKALVVFQFTISVILIIASVVISDQMKFLRTTNPGFDKDGQIILPLRSDNAKKLYSPLKNAIKANSQVLNVTASKFYPGIRNANDGTYYKDGQNPQDAIRVRVNTVDESYFNTLGIELLAGRPWMPGDTSYRVIFNERAIRDMGFASAEEAVGKNVHWEYQGRIYTEEIQGVVRDFNFESLQHPVSPFSFDMNKHAGFNYLIIHAGPGDTEDLLKSIETTWNRLNPGEPFDYSFLNDDFQRNYEADNRLMAVIRYFTFIAIFISCMGLFGLVSFSMEQRTKEIGIRKVLGAGVTEIVTLLTSNFLKLVLLAVVIATPVAWYVMNRWLQDFAYHITIQWYLFVVTTVIACLIAVFTISLKAVKAALANPVKSLRTE